MEKIKRINKLFSTADAEDIEFSSDGYDLVVKFTDWQNNRFTLLFPDTEHLLISEYLDNEKYDWDCPQIVKNSDLIKKMKLDGNRYIHYVLGFNAWSNMEIVSEELKILNVEQLANT
jgi:hypothetical protein